MLFLIPWNHYPAFLSLYPVKGLFLLRLHASLPCTACQIDFMAVGTKKCAMLRSSKKHLSLRHLIILLSENKRQNISFIYHYSLKSEQSSAVSLAPAVTSGMNYFINLIYLYSCSINFMVGMNGNEILKRKLLLKSSAVTYGHWTLSL